MSVVYYGTISCSAHTQKGNPCTNLAYWSVQDSSNKSLRYLCGVHAKNSTRKKLPKDPEAGKKKRAELQRHQKEVESTARANQEEGKMGQVRVSPLRMFRSAPLIPGYLNVFPNNRHQNRQDGLGCAQLSPMRLGPVEHPQPGLPRSENLENFHQGNKCFPSELDSEGEPSQVFYSNQKEMYQSKVPQRHKKEAKYHRGKNKNIPAYAVWRDPDRKVVKLTYIQSRQLYCHYYQKLATQTQDYLKLKKKLQEGYNLNIVGYDGYPVTKSLEEHYLDPSRPFGHELVLYSLLVGEHPWVKHTNLQLEE